MEDATFRVIPHYLTAAGAFDARDVVLGSAEVLGAVDPDRGVRVTVSEQTLPTILRFLRETAVAIAPMLAARSSR
jgi:hypothetical protein